MTISVSIDLKKLDKARFKPFKKKSGEEALYLELILIDHKSDYGDFFVKQSVTKRSVNRVFSFRCWAMARSLVVQRRVPPLPGRGRRLKLRVLHRPLKLLPKPIPMIHDAPF